MTNRLAKVCLSEWKTQSEISAARTTRSNAVRKERYGVPFRLRKKCPVALELILTSSKVACKTSLNYSAGHMN
jgi:hypothetical protein